MKKLKTKIIILLSFLALIIILLGIAGSQFISRLSADSGEIIKDNYKSLQYFTAMQKSLDGIYILYIEKKFPLDTSSQNSADLFTSFEANLLAAEKNITEPGEEELFTLFKRNYFEFRNILRKGENNSITAVQIKDKYEDVLDSITELYKINSDAILYKNEKAANTARQISNYMIILSIISLVIAMGFIFYFPGYILRPVTNYEERDAAKTNLIATVSHELKTPLSSINLSVKLLEDSRLGKLSESQQKITGTIRQETQRLSKMVNELLDYSQTESGNIKLKMSITTSDEIIDYALTSVMLLLGEKKIEPEVNIESDLPPVKADIEKSVWVLVNLLTNAVRYTPEHGLIRINCCRDKGYVKFSVTDQGPGIEREHVNKIFDKFVQIGNNPKGRGLGLAIAKEFVNSQSGEIWAESEPGKGSTFHFTLPMA